MSLNKLGRKKAKNAMTADDAVRLGQKILSMTTVDKVLVIITNTKQGMTRVANNRVLNGDDGSDLSIELSISHEKRYGIGISIDQDDEASLRATIAMAEEIARARPSAPVGVEILPYGPQQYPDTCVWFDRTEEALDTTRHEVVPQIIDTVKRSGLEGAAFVGGIVKTRAILRNDGLVARSQETDLECTVTARAPDGTYSGWAGQATRDWGRLDATNVATRAITIAKRAANPVAFEPGRRTAIFSPAAVAQIVRMMAYAYSASAVALGASPFTKSFTMGGSKLGLRVFDPRIKLTSNPADVEGGYAPFYQEGRDIGLPVQPITWVDNGVLKTLSYDVTSALIRGRTSHMIPEMARMEPVSGAPTMTIDDMIANCKEGIFVNRLSSVQLLDRQTGMMTGVTRDGCFLVRNGKVERSIKNYRFTDSPFFFLNSVEAIGVPERAAFGHVNELRWPLPPVIVPPLMVRDFNFSSLVDAV